MDELTWARLSTNAFTVGLFAYLGAMVGYFASVAWSRDLPSLIARALAIVGVAACATSIAARGFAAHRVPWGNMYEYSLVVATLTVAAYLVFGERQPRFRVLGGVAAMFAGLTMAIAAEFFYVVPGPLVPALNSYWIKIHVVAAMLGSSLFALGGFATMLYLVQDRRERRLATPRASMAPIMGGALDDADTVVSVEEPIDPSSTQGSEVDQQDAVADQRRSRLPTAAELDTFAYRIIAFAFPIWTFAVIAGAIWAQETWGRYWGWDPKETWSFTTWAIFAGYLHARATAGWRGRKAALVAMVGFASLLVTYYAVNLWIAGLHSYRGF